MYMVYLQAYLIVGLLFALWHLCNGGFEQALDDANKKLGRRNGEIAGAIGGLVVITIAWPAIVIAALFKAAKMR